MPTPKVRDLLPFSHTKPSVVARKATLAQIVDTLLNDPGTREVYVVDDEDRFFGVIPLRRLARFVFTGQVPDKASATELLEYVSAETAQDLALQKAAYVQEDDPLEHVVEIMFRFDINEIPVVDAERAIVGNLNMMELVAAWQRGRLEGLVG